jgi:hypothetical protein
MSIWSHVAAIVRVDDLRGLGVDEPNWDDIFGKECLFESPPEVWAEADEHPEKYLPMGSEGTLQKSVWVNPDKSCMAAYTVSIFGDLRDHTDVDGVINWFKDIVINKVWTRQASITIDNILYSPGTVTWVYTGKEEEE